MEGVFNLRLNSQKQDVERLLCFHARTAAFLVPNWQEIWNVQVPRFATIFQPKINEEINLHTFQELAKDRTFLAAVWVDNSPHLMVTATKRQTAAFCSTCDSQSCLHYRTFKATQRDETNPVCYFVSSMRIAENNADNSNEVENVTDHEVDEEISDMDETNVDDDIFVEDMEVDADRHYLDPPPRAEYNKKYGYNHSKI